MLVYFIFFLAVHNDVFKTQYIGSVTICLDTLPVQKNDYAVESVLNLPQTMNYA